MKKNIIAPLETLINEELERLGIDADAIDALKKEHKTDTLHQIHVYSPDKTKVAVGFLKPAKRDVIAYAMQLHANKETLAANEFVLDNCFVGGNRDLVEIESYRIGASVQAGSCVEILEGGVKKV